MILFVFEGGKAEPTVFDSIGKLFLPNEELCVVKCRHDLPTLYSNLRANGYDLFRSLPFEDNGVILPKDKRLDTLFSQVFLFFDYDFQNRIGAQKVNNILDEMLDDNAAPTYINLIFALSLMGDMLTNKARTSYYAQQQSASNAVSIFYSVF